MKTSRFYFIVGQAMIRRTFAFLTVCFSFIYTIVAHADIILEPSDIILEPPSFHIPYKEIIAILPFIFIILFVLVKLWKLMKNKPDSSP